MTTELVKVDPQEFGLEVSKASKIEQSFAPIIVERDALIKVYENILTQEITPETCKAAKELRLKLVKVRTSTDKVHRAEKAFFLAAGKFVDAWKNKTNTVTSEMETKLSEIENYYVELERKRIEELEAERNKIVSELTETPAANLGLMEQSVFDSYVTGLKVQKESAEKAEREAEEERQRVEKENALHHARKEDVLHLWNFMDDDVKALHFGQFTAEEWGKLTTALNEKKAAYDKEQAKIKAENERLRKEAEEKERLAKIEREKAEKKAAEEKAEQDRLLAIERKKQEELQAELKAKQDAEIAAKREAERILELRESRKILLKPFSEYVPKIIPDLGELDSSEWEDFFIEISRAKENKEKEEKERIAAEKAAKAAPDKDKLNAFIESLSLPNIELTSMEAAAIESDIRTKFENFKKWAKAQIETI